MDWMFLRAKVLILKYSSQANKRSCFFFTQVNIAKLPCLWVLSGSWIFVKSIEKGTEQENVPEFIKHIDWLLIHTKVDQFLLKWSNEGLTFRKSSDGLYKAWMSYHNWSTPHTTPLSAIIWPLSWSSQHGWSVGVIPTLSRWNITGNLCYCEREAALPSQGFIRLHIL